MTTKNMFLLCLTTAFLSSTATVLLLRGVPEAHADAQAAPEKILKAEKFVLVDEKGAQRGVWEINTTGVVRLTLCNKEGKARLDLSLYENENPSLDLYDRDRKYRASLGLDADGSPSLHLRGKNQSSVNVLQVDAGGKGSAIIDGKPLK
jgi:hypothetical protein